MPLLRMLFCALLANVILALHVIPAPREGGNGSPTRYEELYQEFMKMSVDHSRGTEIAKLTLVREAATFTFGKGKLYLCNPVGGFPCAAAFIGEGTFDFTPTLDIEQDQLYRFFEKKSMHEEINFVLMIFADSTLRELYHKCKFSETGPDAKCDGKIHECLKFMDERDGSNFNPEIMRTFLEFENNGLFYSHIETKKEGTLFFEINPFAEEEVALMRKNQGQTFGVHWAEVISQFHREECYARGTLDHSLELDPIRVEKYAIASTIKENLDFSADAQVRFASRRDNMHWCSLHLFDRLVVDSVALTDHTPVPWYRNGDGTLWINLDPPLQKNQLCSLQIRYHGELLKKESDLSWILIESPDVWFPRTYSTNSKALFDLTFRTPSRYVFVAVGDLLESKKEDDVFTSHWVTRRPIRNASFNIGSFKEYKIEEKSIPPVTVLISPYAHQLIASEAAKQGLVSGTHMEENVGIDVKGSLQFYQAIFGKCQSERLYATEIPAYHGEAFPGLIHLSWVTFQGEQDNGEQEVFRAHEVAHQWWGIGVDSKTYHDRWLNEGFSDYSGLWYMQTALKDNDKFFKVLRNWRDEILNNRKFIFGSGQESGPIWLGNRTATSTTQEDFNLIIYRKGAWVLHMLRMMLVDLQTLNEDKFKSIMKNYYATYVDSEATTYDFQRVIEKELGLGMGWFFKQWVYGMRIPHYTFAYKTEETTDGKYKVSCQVHQTDVPDDFQMPVPLYVDFGNKKFVRLRVIVKGPVSNFDLPLLPSKPEKIIFNDFDAVLCEVDNVSWSDH